MFFVFFAYADDLDGIFLQHVVDRKWFAMTLSLPALTKQLLRLCTDGEAPLSSTCCICHPGSTPLKCVDGELEAEAVLTSSLGRVSCVRDVVGGNGTEESDAQAACPFVCECQRKCVLGKPDSFITWTLMCSFVAFLILYYTVNSCAVALTARATSSTARTDVQRISSGDQTWGADMNADSGAVRSGEETWMLDVIEDSENVRNSIREET